MCWVPSLPPGSTVVRRCFFPGFVEGAAGLCAIFVAIVINRMEFPVVLLMLALFATGMLVISQFARMRNRLEEIVNERTRLLREQATELEQQATHDQLTGLFNRRFAERFLEEGITDFIEQQRNFSIALVDLDHFKLVNDTFNHEKCIRDTTAVGFYAPLTSACTWASVQDAIG